MELATVNQEAARIAQRLRTDHSRAAVSRVLARRVVRDQDITEAVFVTMDELKTAPRAICPIEDVPDAQTDEASSQRRDRSEPRTAWCMSALFALFDDAANREALEREFPGSSVVAAIDDAEAKADQYVRSIFELIERWPVLALLAGTTETARYDLPAACSDETRQWVTTTRGHAHRNRGAYQKAQTEYEERLSEARDAEDRRGEANSLGNLGLVAKELSEYEDAREYYQQSLDIARDIGDRQGEATSLNNLGLVAEELGEYEDAREYHQQSLDIKRELGHPKAELVESHLEQLPENE